MMTNVPPLVIAALGFLTILCVAACAVRWYGERNMRRETECMRASAEAAEAAELAATFEQQDNESHHEIAKRAVRSHAEARRRDAILYKDRQGAARSIRESPAAIRNRQNEESTDDDLMGALIVSSMVTGTMDTCSEIPSTDDKD